MKYELVKYSYDLETDVDEKGDYSVNITILLHPADGFTPDFTKYINVISNNSMTGFQVDAQRQTAIQNYLIEINT